MSDILQPSVSHIVDNLQALGQDAVGTYPFVFLLEKETTDKLIKLNTNLKALGQGPVDTNRVMNDALSQALDGLLITHVHPEDRDDYYIPKHFFHPEVGDWWNERCSSYLTVHEVFNDDDMVIHLMNKLAGLEEGMYRINRKWLARFVAYDGRDVLNKEQGELTRRDFVAWLTRGSSRKPEVEEKRAMWYAGYKDTVQDIRHFDPTYPTYK